MTAFRAKFIAASSKRLNGVVILATPISYRLYSACCIAVLATSVLFLCLATYTRHATVIGWLVPDGGLILKNPLIFARLTIA